MASDTTRTAMIIGGTGQIGAAAARRLAHDGWSVLVAHRGQHSGDAALADLDVTTIRLDRDDTDALLEPGARARPGARHRRRTSRGTPTSSGSSKGDVGSVVVISTGSVYTGADGGYLDIVTGPEDFPDYPIPLRETDETVDNDERTYSPLKAAMERQLFEAESLPVSILRPGAIHGPFSPALREWFFIKRALDHRKRVVLSDDGTNRFSTSSTVQHRRAGHPVRRAAGAAHPERRRRGQAQCRRDRPHGLRDHGPGRRGRHLPGPPVDNLGSTPWTVAHPLILSMAAATVELGYRQPTTLRGLGGAPPSTGRCAKSNSPNAEAMAGRRCFPTMAARAQADGWFDYAAENAFLRDRVRER